MALTKAQTRDLVVEINQAFDVALGGRLIPAVVKQQIRDQVLGPAFAEIEELVQNSRAPRMYLFGRSGHGKSSLVNALANREVVTVGDIKPTTASAQSVHVEFPDVDAAWEFIDSRGIFESTRPEGASAQSPIDQVLHDIEHFKPD